MDLVMNGDKFYIIQCTCGHYMKLNNEICPICKADFSKGAKFRILEDQVLANNRWDRFKSEDAFNTYMNTLDSTGNYKYITCPRCKHNVLRNDVFCPSCHLNMIFNARAIEKINRDNIILDKLAHTIFNTAEKLIFAATVFIILFAILLIAILR